MTWCVRTFFRNKKLEQDPVDQILDGNLTYLFWGPTGMPPAELADSALRILIKVLLAAS